MEFELNLDRDGRPCIRFIHRDKSNKLEEKILKEFIDGCTTKGMKLVKVSGFISTERTSYDTYEIRIK